MTAADAADAGNGVGACEGVGTNADGSVALKAGVQEYGPPRRLEVADAFTAGGAGEIDGGFASFHDHGLHG